MNSKELDKLHQDFKKISIRYRQAQEDLRDSAKKAGKNISNLNLNSCDEDSSSLNIELCEDIGSLDADLCDEDSGSLDENSCDEDSFNFNINLSDEECELLERFRKIYSEKNKRDMNMAETIIKFSQEFVDKHDPARKAERQKKRK